MLLEREEKEKKTGFPAEDIFMGDIFVTRDHMRESRDGMTLITVCRS